MSDDQNITASTNGSLPAGQEGMQTPEENAEPLTEPPLEIKNMEAHHPHHVTHKKKWREYLLEFFMLFFAVFLGFITENYREHLVNREIEERNIESFYGNLREDSVSLINAIEVNKNRLQFLDSIIVLKGSNLPVPVFNERFIYFMLRLGYVNYFVSNGSTFEQMKSSGSLRLISHHNILDSILKYETLYTDLRRQGEICIMWWNKSIEKISETIDLVPLTKLGANPLLGITHLQLESITLPSIPADESVLRSYYNWRVNERIAQGYYNEKLYQLLDYLRILIPFFKHEYHLK